MKSLSRIVALWLFLCTIPVSASIDLDSWSVRIESIEDRDTCVLESPAVDEAGNRLSVTSLDGGWLWMVGLAFIKPSDVVLEHSEQVEFSVEFSNAPTAGYIGVARTDQVNKIGFESRLYESTSLLDALFEGNHLSISGKGISRPLSVSLIGFTKGARSLLKCLRENKAQNKQMTSLMWRYERKFALATQHVVQNRTGGTDVERSKLQARISQLEKQFADRPTYVRNVRRYSRPPTSMVNGKWSQSRAMERCRWFASEVKMINQDLKSEVLRRVHFRNDDQLANYMNSYDYKEKYTDCYLGE